jgi:hypothetical protein
MLDYRSPVILALPPIVLALGLALWLATGRNSFVDRTRDLQIRMEAIRLAPLPSGQAQRVADAIARPLFALTTGPGAVTEAVLRLEGVARSPARQSALISINGKPARWIERGETVDDITLEDVTAGKVVVDTPIGVREVKLGQIAAPTASPQVDQEIPPGFRSPPPPASAPAMGG